MHQHSVRFTGLDLGRAALWKPELRYRAALTKVALGTTVLGWSLLWAEALDLIHLLPLWAAALIFAGGLGLIPFSGAALPIDGRTG